MPFKPEERQYRSFMTMQATDTDEGHKAFEVEGYATTFDVPYEYFKDYDGNQIYEMVDRNALIGADMSDVIFQLNHEGQPLARLRNKTLELMPDDHGLKIRAQLGGSSKGRELYEAISNGLIDRMSWGFTVPKDGWDYDEDTRTSKILRVEKVYDVSAVSLPADEDTEIHARSYLDGVIEAEHQELVQRKLEQEKNKLLLLASIR